MGKRIAVRKNEERSRHGGGVGRQGRSSKTVCDSWLHTQGKSRKSANVKGGRQFNSAAVYPTDGDTKEDTIPTGGGDSADDSSISMRALTHTQIARDDQDRVDRANWHLAICFMLGIISYFGLICAFYMPVEGWSVGTCLYFAVVTFTTVGYGDFYPRSDEGEAKSTDNSACVVPSAQ